MSTNEMLLRDQLPGGAMWSRVVRRGQGLRITDVFGGATPAMLVYNAHAPSERYNMADTLKAQHTAYLTRGHVLYSDMGRVLMSVVEDSAGWHDTFTGHMTRAASQEKFGRGDYQTLRNDFYRDTRSNFLIELGKYGLSRRDLCVNLNLFVKVAVGADGELVWASPKRAGQSVTLRADMDVLVVLSNTPHLLDPEPSYAPKPIELALISLPELAADDPCRSSCPENARGFQLNAHYHT